jgi:glycosyltransferase involved in cell wall biosynthesis
MNQTKRIAIYLFSYDGIASWCCGVGTVVRHFIHSMPVVAEHLQQHGLEVVFYAGTPFYNPKCTWYRSDILNETHQICRSLSGDVLYQLNGTHGDDMYVDVNQWQATSIGSANQIINYFQKYDLNVVFVHDTPYCGVASVLFQQLSQYNNSNKPIIIWVPHSTGVIHQLTRNENRYSWEKQAVVDANTYAECFVAHINDFMKNHLIQDYQASLEKLVPLVNGFPLFETLNTSPAQAVINKYGLPTDRDIIFATGRAAKYKGFEYLVEAFAASQQNHDAELILFLTSFATSQTQGSYEDVIRLFQELNVRGRVINNFIPQEDLRAIFRLPNVKAVVVPSLAEPFGMIPLEVRHWCNDNAPVIVCSQVDGLKELIDHGKDGFLVDIHHTQEFANILTHVINMSPEEKKDFSIRGKEKLEIRHNMPKNIVDSVLYTVSEHL